MWSNLDPRTGRRREGAFRVDLMHEFGHWVTGEHGGLRPAGLGLYGLDHNDDGTITATLGGGVLFRTCLPLEWEFVVAHVGGVVAEKLADDEAFPFGDPIQLLSTDPDLLHDLNNAKEHLAKLGIRQDDATRVGSELSRAIVQAAEIVRPLLPRLRDQVAQLEDLVRADRLGKLEIEWSAKHAALLTGKDPSWYE
jgi:hypothetical protein